MITLSDLTLLLLGFCVLWYVAGARQARTPDPATVSAEKPPVAASADPAGWEEVRAELSGLFTEAGVAADVTIESDAAEIVLTLKDSVPFKSGSAGLEPPTEAIIARIAAVVLSRSDLSVEVSGHTDDVPIATPNFPSNWELSAARAARVARHLIENGVDPSRIRVLGYADQRPRAASRRENRRVEIRLYRDGAGRGAAAG
ncbi:MAG TPA: OmpA family protein [candidate division Zixibacteria bacterium]|nr:OmpA family protein [candidate division Zixibacteria bacterium]